MEMEEIAINLTEHAERIRNLEAWQKKQNGSLQRIEGKVDKIYIWLIGLMGGVITSLFLLITQILK
jgi:hypothetical protein